MEKVLDRRSCILARNSSGLYDLTISDGPVLVTEIKNVTFQRAVCALEDYMHTKERTE
jgi:hypothetical protein